MQRKRIHSFACLLPIMLGIQFCSPVPPSDKKPDNPSALNLLLVTIDTMRADRLGCYGDRESETDRIDRLAQRGTLFGQAFANTTTTLPSHANILLGTTPNYHGVHENLNFKVSEELLTLAEFLSRKGYATGAFVGAYPLDSRFGLSQGFDVYDDHYNRVHHVNPSSLERPAEVVVDSALGWLRRQHGPWFLWVHCWDPHSPYDPPEPFKTRFRQDPYAGEIAYVDSELGRLFDFLQEKDLSESTAVILTGDHGESLGDHGEKTHGYFAYNSTLRIPLIISVPGKRPGRIETPVSHIDLFPTVCELLGMEKPEELQGASLASALEGKRPQARPVYFESLYPYYSRDWAPIRGIILQGKKFIDSPIPELYDLENDFDETNNLSETEKLDPYLRRLKAILKAQTPDRKIDAEQAADMGIRKKMASLGYMSSPRAPRRRGYGPSDDVKVLLPLINRAAESLALHRQGNTEGGIRGLRELIRTRQDVDMAYTNLAAIYRETSRNHEAIGILEQGLEAIPDNYEIFQEYVKLLIDTGQFAKVIEAFTKANLREEEFDPEAWNNLGIAYAKTGDFEAAVRAYRAGLVLDGRYPELYNNLGNASYSLALQTQDARLFNGCLEYFKKAIEIDPGYPAPYFGLGHAYRQAGDIEAAVHCWEKTLEIEPDFRQAYVDLATAYAGTEKTEKALALIESYRARYAAVLTQNEKSDLAAFLKKIQR